MFHHWLSIDSDDQRTDQCFGCGVIAPDFGEGVMSDHGPLPIMCPGPDATEPWIAHSFDASGDGEIECSQCMFVIDGYTLPADVDWRCNPSGLWHCPVHPDATPDHVDSDGTILWSCGGVDYSCRPVVRDEWAESHWGTAQALVPIPF